MSIKRLGGVRPGFQANSRIDSLEVSLGVADAHTNSYDPIEFDTIESDTGDWFDTTAHTWTPSVGGLYLHSLNLRFAASEVWYLTFYDVTNSTSLMNKQRYNSLVSGYGAFWAWAWWLEANTEYDIRLYTVNSSSISVSVSSRLWVTGPMVTT